MGFGRFRCILFLRVGGRQLKSRHTAYTARLRAVVLVGGYRYGAMDTSQPGSAQSVAGWRIDGRSGLVRCEYCHCCPYFIPYFNEIAGGSGNAYKYFSDSSVDWGQDLVRLHQYVEDHPEIDKIAIDYFGGGSPDYYFCDRRYTDSGELIATSAGYDCSKSKFEPWHAQYGEYQGDYIAVSETFWKTIGGMQPEKAMTAINTCASVNR